MVKFKQHDNCRTRRRLTHVSYSTKIKRAPTDTIHRGAAAFLPKKAGLQTFLHSQAPSRANAQWRLCLGAITEFTAAGQSEILTHIPN